ncbi:MAG: DUF5665 domain-containing protein [Syntrophomonas sp.]
MEREPGNRDNQLDKFNRKLDEISLSMEKLGIAEYVEMLRNPRRLFFINFWAGLARGFGMAVGFTILGAIIIYILQKLIILNIPLIGDFIADLVNIVQIQLKLK